jgi:hypothetical protein
MKFLASPDQLNREFRRLLKQYRHLDWAVAWATDGHEVFELLVRHRTKIRRVVVGTQFHQTSPAFIDAFAAVPEVRFRFDQEGLNGVFHPKLYLFSNDEDDWEVVIGSANFTAGAFTGNTEHAVLIEASEASSDLTYAGLVAEVDALWTKGRHFSAEQLAAYRSRWAKNRKRLGRAAGHDDDDRTRKASIYDRDLLSWDWQAFYGAIRARRERFFDGRITILRETQKIWDNQPSFALLSIEDRKKICGTASERVMPWRLFGSMKGAIKFKVALRDQDQHLLSSLDLIPLSGPVTREHYAEFIAKLAWAFDQVKEFGGLAVATRLLCLRRADCFVCVDSKNRAGLFRTLGVSGKDVTVETYWDTVIEPLHDTDWWASARPVGDAIEQTVWGGRVAMVDALFYEGH